MFVTDGASELLSSKCCFFLRNAKEGASLDTSRFAVEFCRSRAKHGGCTDGRSESLHLLAVPELRRCSRAVPSSNILVNSTKQPRTNCSMMRCRACEQREL